MTGECGNSGMPAETMVETEHERTIGIRRFDIIHLMEGIPPGSSGSTSSVSLIRTPTSTVVVDSGSKDSKDKLNGSIRSKGVKVEKINVLVTTRANEMHTGNDGMFVHALQHLQMDEWTKVKGKTNRKIAITDRYHWIDKYLRLQKLEFIEGGALVLLAHLPKIAELVEPSSQHLAGKIVLFAGFAVPSKDDPKVNEALANIRSRDSCESKGMVVDFKGLEDLLEYCDHVIPAFGPMFNVRE